MGVFAPLGGSVVCLRFLRLQLVSGAQPTQTTINWKSCCWRDLAQPYPPEIEGPAKHLWPATPSSTIPE